MQTRIIIAGSRNFDKYEYLKSALQKIVEDKEDIVIVSGTAMGADRLGEKFAVENGYRIKRFPADWDKHGKAAGCIRNEQMAIFASKQKGVLCAFWDGESRGTMNMIRCAKRYGLETFIFTDWRQ